MSDVPALRPIEIGHYTLTENGLDVDGKPTLEEHQGVGDFIRRAVKASGWWLADWINYGETREDWRKHLEAMVDAELVNEGTAKQYKRIVEKFPKKERVEGVAFGHHAVVARMELEPAQRKALLERAKLEGWTQQELRQEAHAIKRAAVIEGQAALEGMFRIILCDPPWKYGDAGIPDSGALGKASRHFPTMTIGDLCKLPVEAHALPNSTLFLWVTTPFLLLEPGPRDVLKAWGFTYKSAIAWNKVLGMPGHYALQITHEHLVIATRGDGQPDVPTPHMDSVFTERRTEEHSAKPEELRRWITKHWTRGPYLELFGRRRVPGWSVFGNDARLWADEMEEQPA